MPVWREAKSYFSAQERAALAWTESVTRVSETNVPDADYQAALTQFDETQLANLTLAIGVINAYNRMAISFRRGPDRATRPQSPTCGRSRLSPGRRVRRRDYEIVRMEDAGYV